MALLTLQNIGGASGAIPTYAAVTASDTLPGGQGVFIHVKNGNAASTDVAVVTPETVDGDLAVADRTVTIAAGAERMIPIPSRYNSPSTGLATVTFTVTATVTVGAFRGPVQP